MTSNFKDIPFPTTFKYSSDSEHIPLEFYEEVFPKAKRIDLLLGYFSSNAFRVLANSFAEFIYNGGEMRIITNHYYSFKDKEELIDNVNLKQEDRVIQTFENLEELAKSFSSSDQHFFNCLKYLLQKGRLKILPVKFNKVDLSHSKEMILSDGVNTISTDGSINFTAAALLRNSESFEVNVSWGADVFKERIKEAKTKFDLIFDKKHPEYNYINSSDLEVVIKTIGQQKELSDLLVESIELTNESNYHNKVKALIEKRKNRFEYFLNDEKGLPRFPYPDGPREYQKDAYNEWQKNNYSGVFAMATGTGKTITSLNCLLNEYNLSKKYNAIILVPSIALLNQWEKEVEQFNFKNIIKIGGGNNWEKDFANYVSLASWGELKDLVIITTYGSFVLDRFQKYFQKVQDRFLLIADEAHNMGAKNIRKSMSKITSTKRIGLSATPKRIYDLEGTDAIDLFFKDKEPYTYSFGMKMALDAGFLTQYKYYPRIVELTEEEQLEYDEISDKLLKFFDFEAGKFKDNPMVEMLLMKRKGIIHKAENKLNLFLDIISDLNRNKKDKYVFAYIPEGYLDIGVDKERILEQYIKKTHEKFPELKMNSYTNIDQQLDEILRGFSEGKIDLLFAMKMLDEGVDVPRAEVGIFASSTGNPRQFIQRRGRLLRKHKEKNYATIYDMIVIPHSRFSDSRQNRIEKNMVKAELNRVAYFSSLALNFYDSKDELDGLCRKYDLDLDQLINELE